jgi:hypothetical protein
MRRWLALPLVGVALGLSVPAVAMGEPAVGRAVGEAGTGLALVRLLPGEKQSAVQVGFGLASASADSEAATSFEKAVARAAPGGVMVQGGSSQTSGSLAQTAPPDNEQAVAGGLTLPSTPLDALV